MARSVARQVRLGGFSISVAILSSKAQGHMHDHGGPDGDAEEYQKNCIDRSAFGVEVPQRHLQRNFLREDRPRDMR